MSYVSKSALIELSATIPIDAYRFIAKRMDYTSHWVLRNVLEGRVKMTVEKYNMIMSHYEFWKRHEKFSTTNENGSFDLWQTSKYYRELNNLINSEEYSLMTNYERQMIVDEQRRIAKQLMA